MTDKETQLYLDYGKTGHPALFRKLFEANAPRLSTIVRHMAKLDKMETEDIIQRVFIKVIEKRKEFRPVAKFSTWLYRVTYNMTLTYIRDRKPGESINEGLLRTDTHGPLELIEDREKKSNLIKAMGQLTKNQRAALMFREYAGNSYNEIGDIMGLSKSAVESLLYHARQNLKKTYKGVSHER